ncbi:hypothetical protein [Sulfuritalea sp.]|uniref:hypothetical protein n=1 Tax=Sulfuritalea sp. TaxID=2480090 RepID=UPI00286D709B|nr:hypothetical protein [Sulfuritalea sp.]
MTGNAFKLKSREEVERFEELMRQYSEVRADVALNYIPLVRAWDQLHQQTDGGRVFSALLDIYLNLHMLHLDLTSVGGIWNSRFSKGKLEGGSVLDSSAKFFGKMDIHRYSSAYILRYRALWDKIMGFLLLLFLPEAYDGFSNAKSRKKYFREVASRIDNLPQEFVAGLLSALEQFDNTYRTAEAHGAGALRKWSLTMEGLDKKPMRDLMGHWNFLAKALIAICDVFNQQDESENEARETPALTL